MRDAQLLCQGTRRSHPTRYTDRPDAATENRYEAKRLLS
jgi:hypothetical protein